MFGYDTLKVVRVLCRFLRTQEGTQHRMNKLRSVEKFLLYCQKEIHIKIHDYFS